VTITFISSQRELADRGPSTAARTVSSVSSVVVEQGGTSQLLISVTGDIDAGNAKCFADQVCALITDDREVCVDLSGVDFFAVDGCTALHAVNAVVMRRGARWSVIPSRGVSRVLQLCDPACLIPLTSPEVLAKPA
jgi:anti-anti-sigma factor